jgi:hypothetical protein
MHGINIGFGKDRGGSGDDWGNENLTSLAQLADMTSLVQLADMTSFSIPVYITDHTGPPKALADVCFGSVEGFVAEWVVSGADNVKSSTWWDN